MRMVRQGEQLRSKSGRLLSPVPKLSFDTDRKLAASHKRLDAWLAQEARAEAAGNEWLTLILPMGDKLTAAERALCNSVLFEEDQST